jgi:hypothetical protein
MPGERLLADPSARADDLRELSRAAEMKTGVKMSCSE